MLGNHTSLEFPTSRSSIDYRLEVGSDETTIKERER